MQWWYYRGQVTTPIDIPGKGPTVIRPREKFQAPYSAVAHLKRLKRVVPCKPPKEARGAPQPPKSEAKPPQKPEGAAVAATSVVASKAEPQATVVEKKVESSEKEGGDKDEKATAKQEKEKETAKEKGARSRRK